MVQTHKMQDRGVQGADMVAVLDGLVPNAGLRLPRISEARISSVGCVWVTCAADAGGVEGFSRSWAQQAGRARLGSKQALVDFFVAVANLLKFAKDARPPVKELDDKNLEQELVVYVTRLIQDRPELAVEALQQAGWQVVPLAAAELLKPQQSFPRSSSFFS